MHRIIEPELMEGEEQASAYAQADASASNALFMNFFTEKFPSFSGKGDILDIGCGPADILICFAHKYPDCTCLGIDGSEAMLAPGRQAVQQEQLAHRISLYCQRLPCTSLPHTLKKKTGFRLPCPTACFIISITRKYSGRQSMSIPLLEVLSWS